MLALPGLRGTCLQARFPSSTLFLLFFLGSLKKTLWCEIGYLGTLMFKGLLGDLTTMFQRFYMANLGIRPSKCSFEPLTPQVGLEFIGY